MSDKQTTEQQKPVMDYGFLRDVLLDILKFDGVRAGTDLATVDEESNLVRLGIIDSFRLLVMISEFEKRTGIEINLEKIDPILVTSIKGFVTEAIAQIGSD